MKKLLDRFGFIEQLLFVFANFSSKSIAVFTWITLNS